MYASENVQEFTIFIEANLVENPVTLVKTSAKVYPTGTDTANSWQKAYYVEGQNIYITADDGILFIVEKNVATVDFVVDFSFTNANIIKKYSIDQWYKTSGGEYILERYWLKQANLGYSDLVIKLANNSEVTYHIYVVDKQMLTDKINELTTINTNEISSDFKKLIQDIHAQALVISEKEDATYEEIALSIEAIDHIIELKNVDKSELNQKIEMVNSIQLDCYTNASVNHLQSILYDAEQVMNRYDATQEEVDLAIASLERVLNGFILIPAMNYEDVQDSSLWFYSSVEKVFQKGLMQATGKVDKTKPNAKFFEPDANITRGMVATVLYRMADMPSVIYTGKFPDVANHLWYTNAIEWSATSGVVSGYKNGKFGTDDNITRQDLAIMLRNYASKAGLDTTATVNFVAFKDGDNVDSYAQSAVAWCIETKLMSGSNKTDGKYLNPKANATRAECAKMFSLLDDLIINK